MRTFSLFFANIFTKFAFFCENKLSKKILKLCESAEAATINGVKNLYYIIVNNLSSVFFAKFSHSPPPPKNARIFLNAKI